MDPELHKAIDERLNCEDLGFSMMASGLSGVAPTSVAPQRQIKDLGLVKGISTNPDHIPARVQCISDFITRFWHKKDPLIYAHDAVVPMLKPNYGRGNWKMIEATILHEK